MEWLHIEAPAKLNWRLKVVGRQADGYHLLSGLMQSISLADCVDLRLSSVDRCRISAGAAIRQQDNLAEKAWQLLKRQLHLRQGLEIVIEKRIPASAGLGGGSADAAAVLVGANALLGLELSLTELSELGLKLGADIPFCLLGGLAKAEGVGEQLTPLPAPPPLPLLLVNPGVSLSTAEVFARYRESRQPFAEAQVEEQACLALAAALARGDLSAIHDWLDNDLAASARQLCPTLRELEQRLRGLGLKPLLCGSGATLFALCESEAALAEAQQDLADLPWVAAAHTGGGRLKEA